MYAHFYGSKVKGYVLIITNSPSIINEGQTYPVATKRDARALAKKLGAICWNF